VTLRILSLDTPRTWARPGTSLEVHVKLRGSAPGLARLRFELLDVATVMAVTERRVRLQAADRVVRVRVPLPETARRGYGLRVTATSATGSAARSTVVEAIDGWWEAPRHIALTDFRPGLAAARQVDLARRWHVTVAQAYDWMYRHYRYEAPTEPFLDALGRRVSHAAVRALVRAGHETGIATLAYGSVYGAEPEYVERHPDERVFDAAGEPYSLGGAFYINDVRPGRPWRTRLLREYEHACRRFGFDGIHMDTYGPPHEAVGFDGKPVRFADLYPGLIEEAAERVGATGRGRRVLFNCVEGFPLEAVGHAPTAALYLELWPPDDRFADLVAWIERAHAAGAGKAIVIAAYVPALRDAEDDPTARASAAETAVLLSTVVYSAGAFHHGIAERDRVLVEGYYPAAVGLRPREAREMRAAWTFSARYLHLLSDPATRPLTIDGLSLLDAEGQVVPVSSSPVAGAVWARASMSAAGRTLSLVDLRDQADDRWTAPHSPSGTRRGWSLSWPGAHDAVAMSPWTRGGAPVPLRATTGGASLPAFRRWLLVLAS